MKKKWVAAVTAATMILGSQSAVFAASFSDIDQVPWEGAQAYINSVGDAGLMVGDTNDQGQTVFRAGDSVTFCETAQLVYSLLKNTGKLEADQNLVTKWQSDMDGYKIPEWAYEAVSYGLEHGFINLLELDGYTNDQYGNYNADRESVAVMFGRMLASYYTTDSSAALTFNDAAEVTAAAVPYVDLLVRRNILVGDDLGNFNPAAEINRAEMAVMVSKTYTLLKEASSSGQSGTSVGTVTTTASGVVGSVDSSKITLTGADSRSFADSADLVVKVEDGSKEADLTTVNSLIDALNAGKTLEVTLTLTDGLVTRVAGAVTGITDADLTSFDAGKGTLTVTADKETYDYAFDPDDEPTVKLDGATVDADKLETALSSDDIQVALTLDSDGLVSKIVAETL